MPWRSRATGPTSEPIAADSELAAFDRTRGADRAALLRRFWTDRDRLELRREGERLREHYRRLLHARRHFALTVSRRFYGDAGCLPRRRDGARRPRRDLRPPR